MSQYSLLNQERSLASSTATDSVSVSNIHAFVNAGFDIWGREKPQPVLASVTIALSAPISSAASNDSLDSSTVHYGHLSKNIVAVLTDAKTLVKGEHSQWEPPLVLAERVFLAALATAVEPSVIAQIEVNIMFSKASRLGDGVRLRICREPRNPLEKTVLSLESLRIPALIGVNAHERLMTQLLVVTVEVHNAIDTAVNAYCELEQLVVKTVEESSFETIESLVEELAARCIKYYIFQKMDPLVHMPTSPHSVGVRVRIEKPSAVMIADTPSVEIFRACGSQDPYGKRMIAELGSKRPTVPFPLAGRLDEFLKSWKQD